MVSLSSVLAAVVEDMENSGIDYEDMENAVRAVYEPFTVEEINRKIVEMLTPEGMTTPVEIVFQSIEGLHTAIPNHRGDWYFTGHYPTPGGTRLCNQAFINYYESINKK